MEIIAYSYKSTSMMLQDLAINIKFKEDAVISRKLNLNPFYSSNSLAMNTYNPRAKNEA